jgi:hypothetical protein
VNIEGATVGSSAPEILCLVTSVSALPSLSNPDMVGVGFVAFNVFPFVARGCGVFVARK